MRGVANGCMEITYQHANPRSGNESFLVRIHQDHEPRTPCLLVDAGDDVSLDELLAEDEYLAGILLTHAHVDHYKSLGDAHRDGAPIFTSHGTGAILDDVFAEGERHHGLENTDSLRGYVREIDGWQDVVGDLLSVHPIPAGHAPGACGFLLQITENDDSFTAVVTGDFTFRDAACYPGFPAESFHGIDAAFLTAATNEDFASEITETLGILAQRAGEGSKTLCTASGLTGVQLATLLAGVATDLDRSLPVTLVGQVAKLYEALEYDYDNVETIPTFSSPSDCLVEGTVTIAGPEVPVEGSSARLFESIRDDPNATLHQVQGGNTNAKDASDAQGTVSSTTFSNHPPESVLDEFVETIAPTHVIVEHQYGHANDPYKDKWESFNWATGDGQEQALHRDGTARVPPWMGDAAERRVRNSGEPQTVLASNAELLDAISPPSIGRQDSPDLEAEGVDVPQLRKRLESGRLTPDVTAPQATTEKGETDRAAVADGGLHRTTGPDKIEVSVTPSNTTTEDGKIDPSTLFDTVPPPTVTPLAEQSSSDDSEQKATAEAKASTKGQNKDSHVGTVDQEGSEESDEDEPVNRDATPDSEPDRDIRDEEQCTTEEENSDEGLTVEIDPVMRALAEQQADGTDTPLNTILTTAIETFLSGVLRGDHPQPDAKTINGGCSLTVDVDPGFEQLIERTMSADSSDVTGFVTETVCEAIGVDRDDRSVTIHSVDTLAPLVDAVVQNEEYALDTRGMVVQAALEQQLLE